MRSISYCINNEEGELNLNYQNDNRPYATTVEQAGYGSSAPVVSNVTPVERGAFLRKVYSMLTAGVGVTMATAFFMTLNALTNENSLVRMVLQGNGMWMLMLAYLALSFGVASVVRVKGINVLAFLFFTAFTGFFISPLLLMGVMKTGSFNIVWQALGLTIFAFGGLTGYVLVSGKDFSFIKGFIWTGFWILLGFMVVGFFIQSWAFHMAITAVGLLVFAGFVLYDTSNIMHRMGPSEWVAGAFSLFIDFINMFIRVLMLLMGRRD